MTYFFVSFENEMWHHIFDVLNKPYEFIVYPSSHNSIYRKIAHVLWKIGIYIKWDFYGKDFYKKVQSITPNDTIIFFAFFPEPILNVLPWLQSNVRPKIWFWDSQDVIACSSDSMINHFKKFNIPIVTFDKKDSIKYGLKFLPQFYNFGQKYENLETQFDCYFLGYSKCDYRRNKLKELERYFIINRISYKFIVVDEDNSKFIGYKENLNNISHCKCIVDIEAEGQNGLSLRPMEAMAYGKKIITTNMEI